MKRAGNVFRDSHSERLKRLKHRTEVNNFGVDCSASKSNETPRTTPISTSDVIDFSDPWSIRKGLDSGKFGSVTKDIDAIFTLRMQIQGLYSEKFPRRKIDFLDEETSQAPNTVEDIAVVDLDDERVADETPTLASPVIIIDSDEEDKGDRIDVRPSLPFENSISDRQLGEEFVKDEELGTTQVRWSSKPADDTTVVNLGDRNVADVIPVSTFNAINIDERPSFPSENAISDLQLGENLVKDEEVKDHTESKAWVEDANPTEEIHSGVEKNEDTNLFERHVDKTLSVEDASVHDEADSTIKKDEDATVRDHEGSRASPEDTRLSGESGTETTKDKGTYVGVEDDESNETSLEDDGFEDVWNEMAMGLETSKDSAADHSPNDLQVTENNTDCEHSFILKDDLGYVCRICGVIGRNIETLFEFQYNKVKRSSRTYIRGSRTYTDKQSNGITGLNLCDDEVTPNEVSAHPRHSKKMKPHQKEGFDFLVRNLVGDPPGGCILAHAPGSGKTFMIICFVQSFLAKYPNARPLVVLPKGIVSTWKKEFKIWQIEDFPLYDTAKADNRIQQLEVLEQWVERKSILFLSYQQFSSIVCDLDSNEVLTSCRDILLKVPSILVLDEGHTPRNDNTDIFQALAKVQTPRKVVLSGTLYQNHVKEVFNILNLVQNNFLRTETSQAIITRIRSKVDMSLMSGKNYKASTDAAFFEMVEQTLQKDKDLKRKASVIHDLRSMTHKVLHYYKGDFLDELPGLVDFSVVVNLSPKQTREVENVRKLRMNFKANYVGSTLYLHPDLQSCSDKGAATADKMDQLLRNLDIAEGVKAKFFLNMLSLCEANKEKLLVFSQYLVPLKFLERLAVKEKGWSLGKEMFVISGKSSNEDREWSMERFNSSPAARVFFGSIKACGEGISLVGASRIIIMDIHLNPSVTRQAIGRAFRPGQTKKVFVYRLVAADSPEVEDYATCSKKELISKTWFESKENSVHRDFQVETVDVNKCGDEFLEGNTVLQKDIKVLYRR